MSQSVPSEQPFTPTTRFAQLCEVLWEAEIRYDLPYRRVCGCYPWAFRRFLLSRRLAHALGVLENIPVSPNPLDSPGSSHGSPPSVGHPRLRLWRNRRQHGRPDWLIIPKTKPSSQHDHWQCPYTTPCIEEALDNRQRVALLWNGTAWHARQAATPDGRFWQISSDWIKHWVQARRHTTQRTAKYLGHVRWKPDRVNLPPAELAFWHQVDDHLEERLGVSINLPEQITYSVKLFHDQRDIYRRILRSVRPREIVLFCHYGKGALIAAARENNINVSEIQHGTMGPYHLGYSYPSWEDQHRPIPYFPDTFWSWAPYWTNKTAFPLPPDRIITKGFTHFQTRSAELEKLTVTRDPNTILVLSQPVIATSIIESITRLATDAPHHQFLFKCHPLENSLPPQQAFANQSNVQVITNADLYALMRESRYVIGVSSTALYEAIALGCKPVFLHLPGIEYMSDLIEDYHVPVYAPNDNFSHCLEQAQRCCIPSLDFF